MKKFLKNKIKIIELVFFGLLGFLIITFNKISFCQKAYEIGFDQQVFLYWDYAKNLNLIPFRDYFYPYGLLLQFRSSFFDWYLIYLLFIFFISVFIFMQFKLLFITKAKTYLFFIIFSIFIAIFVNPDTYVRYAPLVCFSFAISYLAEKNKIFLKISGMLIGLIIGFLFSFINDVSLYAIGIYLIFIVLNMKKISFSILELLNYFLFLILGFLIGIVPILYYLGTNHALNDFILYLKSLDEFYQLAKVAFPPSLKSIENLLIIISILYSIFFLILNRKKNLDFNFYSLMSLVLLILFLEQKNLVRSMYTQISFISLICFFILFNEFLKKVKKNQKNAAVLIGINFIVLLFFAIVVDRDFKLDKGLNSFSEKKPIQCIDKKLYNINKDNLRTYEEVQEFFINKPNSKIFSFPADPIFYILLKQKLPYYPSIYEATPVNAQMKLIDYIRNENINFVIINKSTPKIQDEVPNEIRAKVLYKYIIANYEEYKKIDNFLILKKK